MKKITALIVGLVLSFSISSQTSGGPDPYGYTWKSSDDTISPPTFTWVDITSSGTLVTGLADDNYVGPFTGSNGFQYYWYSTPQFYIGSNGFISFSGVNIASPFPSNIPNPLGANNYMAPLLSDLNFYSAANCTGNPAKCYYYSSTDSLVVSFIDVPYWSSLSCYTGKNTFQIILDKNNYSITYNYLETNMGTSTFVDNIVGIENVTGTLGLSSFIDSVPSDSLTIVYTYPSVVTYQAIDAGMNWADNDQSGGIFIKGNGSPLPAVANVRNNGNQTISNFTVYDTLYNSSGVAVTGGSASVGTLTPSQDTTVIFSDSLAAPGSGRYILKTRVSGVTGDLVAANDVLDLEVLAVDTNGNQMNLEYSDGQADGTGLGWAGGGGGIGIYIEPPIYPAKVKDSRFYLTALGSPAVGFHSIIYDDDGPNGGPGTTLDSVYVGPGSLTANNYKAVNPSTPVIIDSGGVYLLWLMDGNGINLGRDLTPPFSRRTFEILGGAWSGYRDRLTEDFLLGIRVVYAFPRAKFNINSSIDPVFSFVDKSSNKPTAWFWEFGDGGTDTVQNPSHTYIDNDTFNVCLTASNQYGSDSVCKTVIIDGVVPTANFTFDNASAPTITFFDQSTNSPTAWYWDFDVGLGDTSSLQNTAFVYKGNGMFNVCLTAKNKNGDSAPFCQIVEIQGIGLEEFADGAINVFPNPMSDYATIRLSPEINRENIQIRLINMLGKEMPVQIIKNGMDYTIYKDGLSSGLYIVEVSNNNKILSRISLQVND